jgi:hypothetical protein
MSDYKPITSELRKYATVSWDPWPDARDRLYQMCDRIDAIHAQLERENAELRAARGDDWIKLPVDADGLPIHVGDMLAGEKAGGFGLCEPFEVGCIMFGRDIVQVNDVHGLTRCTEFAHHHHDTWESIIDDAEALAREWFNTDMSENEHADGLNALVARCKKLAGDAE